MYSLANFYHFFNLTPSLDLKSQLVSKGQFDHIKGTILLAPEGINCAIQGSEEDLKSYLEFLKETFPQISGALIKESFTEKIAFNRFKVLFKKEIVALGAPQIMPHKAMGTLVDPLDWNDLLKDQNTLLIDTRNDYEIKIGSFPGAVAPHTRHFRQFVDYIKTHKEQLKDKKIAMYCTGGIRCEKASAYLMQEEGLKNVFQLKGGILNYLEKIPADKNYWQGDLFLFDDRCAVDQNLKARDYFFCRSCGDICATTQGKPHANRPGLICRSCEYITREQAPELHP